MIQLPKQTPGHPTKQPTLAIDFDRVICDTDNPEPGKKMGPPMPGAVTGMHELQDRGFRLVIYTLKAITEGGKQAVSDWLTFYDVPYHEVTAIKPNAALYIDDKAYRFEGWRRAVENIYKLLGVEK